MKQLPNERTQTASDDRSYSENEESPKFPVMNERQKSLLLFIARNRLVSFQEIHKHFGGDDEALRNNLRLFRAYKRRLHQALRPRR